MRVSTVLLLSAFLLAAGGVQEDRIKASIANELVSLASWCQSKKLIEEGKGHLAEALGLVPEHPRGRKLSIDGESGADEKIRKLYDRKWKSVRKKVAKYYLKLAAQKQDKVHDGYLIRAYELDEKTGGRAFEGAWRAAYSKKDWTRVRNLLEAGQKVAHDDKRAKILREVEWKAAEKQPVLKTATTHKLEYWLGLPTGFNLKRTWPILVCVDGAGCNFRGAANNFHKNAKDLGYIVVSPCTFANTNALVPKKYNYPQELLDEVDKGLGSRLKFDEEGLLAALADVRKEYNGEEKFFITGFSGGGNLTWRMVFGHPGKLVAAAPACANFASPGPDISKDEEAKKNLPVMAWQGDKDQYIGMLNDQWAHAKRLCDENGYGNVKREMLPGVGHSSCAKKTVEFFKGFLKK